MFNFGSSMRKPFLILLLLLPLFLQAKKKEIPKRIYRGRWVEIKRIKPDSTIVAFTDTLFMTFYAKDSFTYRLRDGFVYRGKYDFDEKTDHLDFGTVSYTLLLSKKDSVVLGTPNSIAYYVRDTSDTAAVIVLQKDEKILPVTDVDDMIGRWIVYKRTIDKDGGGVDFASEIKAVYITGQGSDEKLGYVYCGSDGKDNPSWYIKGFGSDQMFDVVGKNARSIKVVKCQKGELILSENGVNYFFKQFK